MKKRIIISIPVMRRHGLMKHFSEGMLSLFRPRDPLPIPDNDEMEKEIWQAVGDSLRLAMSTYEQTEEYQTAIKIANQNTRSKRDNRSTRI